MNFVQEIAEIWARNAVAKYKIAQKALAAAHELDSINDPEVQKARRVLIDIAIKLEN